MGNIFSISTQIPPSKRRRNCLSLRKSLIPSSNPLPQERHYYDIPNTNYNNLPNNDEEICKLQIQHSLYQRLWPANFSAPVDEVLRAGGAMLDIGCGAGTWLIEMAIDFPRSFCTGVDISANYPTKFKPANVNFVQSNVLNGLPFEDNKFDYVHIKMLTMAFTENEWRDIVIPEMVRVTKPGGYIEFFELDLLPKRAGPCYARISKGLLNELSTRGINGRITELLESLIENTKQIVQIQRQIKYLPLGSWAGQTGSMHEESTMMVLHTLAPQLTRAMGLMTYEFEKLLEKARNEMDEYETYGEFWRVWGQKV